MINHFEIQVKFKTTYSVKMNTSPNNELNGSPVSSAQLSRPRAVTIFAVNGVVCKSKNRASTAGGKVHLAPMR
jgi:hypothetical protein